MKDLQPKINELKLKYGEDKEKIAKAQMDRCLAILAILFVELGEFGEDIFVGDILALPRGLYLLVFGDDRVRERHRDEVGVAVIFSQESKKFVHYPHLGLAHEPGARTGALDVEHKGLVVTPRVVQILGVRPAVEGVLKPPHPHQPRGRADILAPYLVGV